MHPRQSIVESFSTFLKFEADRFSGWVTDGKLRRSMLRCMSCEPQLDSENLWVLYWYNLWHSLQSDLAKEHLTAYLQESCYWAAQKTAAVMAKGHYTLADCFQIAIAKIDTVLKGFNPKQGFGLKNYASAIFSSAIRDYLRQRQEVDICSPWGLLRKISQKRLVEALQQTGLSQETIGNYVLAWNCFKTIYIPTQATATRQLPRPDNATWDAIANLYNTEGKSQLYPSAPQTNPAILEKWLLACAKAVRSYLYPSFVSINAPTAGQDTGELLDNLSEASTESLITQIIDREEQQGRLIHQTDISTVLITALAKLDSQAQTLLQLYYGQGITQQQMAQQLEIKQYTVSRRLTKAREMLLLALATWSKEKLHISLSSEVLKNTSTVLEEWLLLHYKQPNLLASMEHPS